jgi:hypothetical protein
MARERRVVDHDHTVANLRVMGDMAAEAEFTAMMDLGAGAGAAG